MTMETSNLKTATGPLATAALLTALTAVAAWLKIPFPLVPITLQTLFTYAAGLLLKPRMAFVSQAAVLILGLLGVPVFAGGAGPHYVLQPTFGYLLAMPLSAYAIAQVRKDPISILSSVKALVVGIAIIFSIGVLWLYANVHVVLQQKMAVSTAVWSGCIIFIPGELCKGFLAAWIAQKYNKISKESRS
jgi:biotin transport system substrate-specific component